MPTNRREVRNAGFPLQENNQSDQMHIKIHKSAQDILTTTIIKSVTTEMDSAHTKWELWHNNMFRESTSGLNFMYCRPTLQISLPQNYRYEPR